MGNRNINFILCFSSLLLLISACSKPHDQAVPRRQGYARVSQYPPQYQILKGMPLSLKVNSEAVSEKQHNDDGSFWATVHYPRYKAMIYFTFTPLARQDATALVENRLERMRLDLGNSIDINTEEYINPNGITIWTLYAPSSLNTPVKFMALNSDWMVSGSAFLEKAQNADSVAPIVQSLLRDVRYSMLTLGD